MSFCNLVVGAHRLDKSLTETSKLTTIKTETIDTTEEGKQQTKPASGPSGNGGEQKSFCWADQVIKEEQKEEEDRLREKKSDAATMLAGSDSQMSLDESNTSGSRQIEIDILDSANVEKYEKLVRCDMIKSPFKRRLSGDDKEDGEPDGDGDDANPDRDGRGGHGHKKTKTHEDDHGRERFRRESTDSGDGSSQSSRRPVEYEKDIEILVRRQKQIDYGKNTLGYENYLQQVPREQRTKEHPKTPPKHIKYSRRAWDGLVRVWRKKLHCFDPDARPDTNNEAADEN